MPENTILLVPLLCLIAIGVLLRRGAGDKRRTVSSLEVGLEVDTAPLQSAWQAMNEKGEGARTLLRDIESAAATAEAARTAREQSKPPAPSKQSNQRRRAPAKKKP